MSQVNEGMELPYAGIGKRFFASVIDSIVVSTISGIAFYFGFKFLLSEGLLPLSILLPSTMIGLPTAEPTLADFGYALILIAAIFLIIWLYYAVMDSSRGGTIGKLVMGLQVTDLEGGQVSFLRATGRYFARALSQLTFGIGYLMAAFTPRKQALHDLIAGTLVLDSSAPASYDLASQIADAGYSGHEPAEGIHTLNLDENAPFGSTTENSGFGEVEDAFGVQPVQPVQPIKPVPVPSPVFAEPHTTPKRAMPKKNLAVPLPEIMEQKNQENALTPPAGRTCPGCGAKVGEYQTQCAKCHTKLQQPGIRKFWKK